MFESLRPQPTSARQPLRRPKALAPFDTTGNKYYWDFIISKPVQEMLDYNDLLVVTDQDLSFQEKMNYLHANTDVAVVNPDDPFQENTFKIGDNIHFLQGVKNRYLDFTYSFASRERALISEALTSDVFGMTVTVRDFASVHSQYEDSGKQGNYLYRYFTEGTHDTLINVYYRNDGDNNFMIIGGRTNAHVNITTDIVVVLLRGIIAERDIKAVHKNIDELEFEVASHHQQRYIGEAQANVETAKLNYKEALLAYQRAFNLDQYTKKRADEIREALRQLTDRVMTHEYVKDFHFDLYTNSREHILTMSVLRKESIMVPYNNADDEEIKHMLYIAQQSRVDEDSEDYRTLDSDKPLKFIMPESIMAITINYNINVDVNTWNMMIRPARSRDGRQGYWDSNQAHPHAGSASEPCYGDFAVPMSDAVNQMDFATVFIMGNIFCNTYNHDDAAGRFVINWDQADA